MSAFGRSHTVKSRSVSRLLVGTASTVAVPAGATNIRVYARNTTATASSISVGNAVGGAQFAAVTAVPTGTKAAPGYINPAKAGPTIVYQAAGLIHITATVGGVVDVTVEWDELGESLVQNAVVDLQV